MRIDIVKSGDVLRLDSAYIQRTWNFSANATEVGGVFTFSNACGLGKNCVDYIISKMIKKEMSKGFASKMLLRYVKAGDVWKAAKRINDGGRHLELWSFMKHWDLLYDFPIWKYDLECSHLEKGYVTGRTILQLAPVVGYRAEKARQAAIAFLSLKRRGLLSKDMSTLIAKMIYLPYENRYSEKWGHPLDFTTPLVKTAEFLGLNQLKLVAFVMVFAVLSHLVRKFLIPVA